MGDRLRRACSRPGLRSQTALLGIGSLGLMLALAVSAAAEDPPSNADPADQVAVVSAVQAAPSASPAPAGPPARTSKSGYDDAGVIEGTSGVGGQLVADDAVKKPLIHWGFLREGFYKEKRKLKDKYGIELNSDYNFLNQFASQSATDRQASSGALRFYGRWFPSRSKDLGAGRVVFRFENRHRIGPGITPRDLGWDAGSALSTASFKAFGWGVTSLYWEQGFFDRHLAFVAGQMDPGDFEDIHPLLNAWTAFMNDGTFNNPTTALPQQGLGSRRACSSPVTSISQGGSTTPTDPHRGSTSTRSSRCGSTSPGPRSAGPPAPRPRPPETAST